MPRIIAPAHRWAAGAHRWAAGARRRALPTMEAIVDLLLPDQCRICGAVSDQAGYCPDCAEGLPRHERQCRVCGVPFTGEGVCGRCQRQAPPLLETVAPFRYAPPISDAVHELKYHRKLASGRDLGLVLAGELERRAARLPEALIPVPLHWRRQFQRGFNQSLEIAIPVSRAFDIPIDPGLVERHVRTIPQVGLMPAQRRRNLRGAFRWTGARVPDSAAIIDDVVTSGATVFEVARCLRKAGVTRISVWAVARV